MEGAEVNLTVEFAAIEGVTGLLKGKFAGISLIDTT